MTHSNHRKRSGHCASDVVVGLFLRGWVFVWNYWYESEQITKHDPRVSYVYLDLLSACLFWRPSLNLTVSNSCDSLSGMIYRLAARVTEQEGIHKIVQPFLYKHNGRLNFNSMYWTLRGKEDFGM